MVEANALYDLPVFSRVFVVRRYGHLNVFFFLFSALRLRRPDCGRLLPRALSIRALLHYY